MASKYHDDWQSSKKTISERNAYMFNNELLSDVSFTCGESSRIFHAHKYVLATSSAVFFAMFYGDLAKKGSTIRISDTDEKSFEEFLRYLYTDEWEVTAENATGVLYLAKKYLISHLAKKCRKFLEANIQPDNVCVVLDKAIQLDENKLEAMCWGIVSEKTRECVSSEAFCSIGPRTVNALLKRDMLAIIEVELFEAVLKWVDRECARQGIINIDENKTARRRAIGESVYDIRFAEMSQEDFAKYVPSAGILTETEIISIFQTFSGLDVADSKWKKIGKRWQPSIQHFPIHQGFKSLGDNSDPDGTKYDVLTASVNKAVAFHGVCLFGDANGSEYEVQLEVKDKKVTGTYTSHKTRGYDVMLTTPVYLQPNEEFTMTVKIKGPDSYWNTNRSLTVNVGGIALTFHTSDSSNTEQTDQNGSRFSKIYLSRLQ